MTMPLEPGTDNPSLQIVNMQARFTPAPFCLPLPLRTQTFCAFALPENSVSLSSQCRPVGTRAPCFPLQAVKEAALAQDALKVIVDLVSEPLARHPHMSEKVHISRKFGQGHHRLFGDTV